MQVILDDPFVGKRVEESNFSTVPLRDEFLENARLFIFETYCRIHQQFDMGYVPNICYKIIVVFFLLWHMIWPYDTLLSL
jgi:hypothetical protein